MLTFGELCPGFAKLLKSPDDIGQARSGPEVLLFQTKLFPNHVVVLIEPISGAANSNDIGTPTFGYKTRVRASALFELSTAFS